MKLSKKTLSVLIGIFALAIVFISVKVFAGVNDSVSGYMWSSNIGWIKMNDCDDPSVPSTCSGGSYGVNIPSTDGPITGTAWSSNIGWITFDSAGCPTSGCTPGARVIWNGSGGATIRGWARACSVFASGCSGALASSATTGTWDGFIALDSVTGGGSGGVWGLTITPSLAITGFAWGSEVIGWIESISGNAGGGSGPTVTLTANPTTISAGASSVLTITATNIDNASSCSIDNGLGVVTMTKTGGTWTGNATVTPGSTTTYTVGCSKGSVTKTASATVNVLYFTLGAGSSGAYGSCVNEGDGPLFAWNSTASSCTISGPGGSTSVSGSSQAAGGSLATNGLYYIPVAVPVVEGSNTYTLQCGGTSPITLTQTVNSCAKDYALSIGAVNGTLVPGAEGKMQATYTITAIPSGGFKSPIALSVASKPANLPKSAAFTFGTSTLTVNGVMYNTTTITVTINTVDLKKSTTYTPIVIQGFGGGLLRTAQFSIGSDVKLQTVFTEF